ncbi:MlaD family protein [Actinomadura sp. DC4]|uniref:MCE family protein n=1 Tax=Actinomadura sp. DC4 TaxID=3055069 RepID=UPI0025B1C233|nr:MlaD family protein [Actinomadura sp. DC4]MDN3351307.1 MlaD family protein [Actinomadura sp. DC4]
MALKSFRDRNPIAVGVVSVTVLALAVVTVFLTGTLGLLKDRYAMSGVFADTGSIRTGDEVRVAGVPVGEVTAVEPEFGRGDVIITWKVDSKVRLGAGTRAEIETANILGGRYVRLSGPVSSPYMRDLPASRRRIPLSRTKTPVSVNEVLKDSTEAVSKLDTASLNKVLDQLSGLTVKNRGRLGRSLQNLTALAQTVDDNDPQIHELLDNGDKILTLASSKDRQLSRLLAQARSLLAELRRRRTELTTILGSGSAAVRSIGTLIDEHQSQLTAIMADLRTTLTTLRPRLDSLDSVLAWAGPTLTGLSGIGGYGPWLEIVFTGLGPLSPQDLAALVKGRP